MGYFVPLDGIKLSILRHKKCVKYLFRPIILSLSCEVYFTGAVHNTNISVNVSRVRQESTTAGPMG